MGLKPSKSVRQNRCRTLSVRGGAKQEGMASSCLSIFKCSIVNGLQFFSFYQSRSVFRWFSTVFPVPMIRPAHHGQLAAGSACLKDCFHQPLPLRPCIQMPRCNARCCPALHRRCCSLEYMGPTAFPDDLVVVGSLFLCDYSITHFYGRFNSFFQQT